MNPPHNARAASHTRRPPPTHARAARPPPLKRTTTGTPGKKSPTTRASLGWSKEVDVEDDDMAGLPQFCATCEKQMVTPGNSILYCSESCRKKDHSKPLQVSMLPQDMSPQPSARRVSYFGDDMSDASPMRSPTALRPPSMAFSDSSDSSSYYDRRSSYARNESEAAHYLAHFGISDSTVEYGASYDNHRPSTSQSAAPSLSHTPTSVISTSGSYRPLPRRGNPFGASFSSFSVDLITPVFDMESSTLPSGLHHQSGSVRSTDSTSTAFLTADGEMKYDKRPFSPEPTITPGSLRQLFSHDAMQAPPRPSLRLNQSPAHLDVDPMDKAGLQTEI